MDNAQWSNFMAEIKAIRKAVEKLVELQEEQQGPQVLTINNAPAVSSEKPYITDLGFKPQQKS